MTKSMFITFEGGEGSGKTTQIERLADYIAQNHNIDVVLTREPGGTEEAEKIRDFLVQRDGGDWLPMAECLMFFAARHMHVETLIKPALNDGKIVLCDRFTDSTRAYQSYGLGLPLEKIEAMNALSLDGFEPDLTFIIDVPVKIGLERAGKRLSDDASTEDRYENLDISFHEKLHGGFLDIAGRFHKRCILVDGLQDIDTIAGQIAKEFTGRFKAHKD